MDLRRAVKTIKQSNTSDTPIQLAALSTPNKKQPRPVYFSVEFLFRSFVVGGSSINRNGG